MPRSHVTHRVCGGTYQGYERTPQSHKCRNRSIRDSRGAGTSDALQSGNICNDRPPQSINCKDGPACQPCRITRGTCDTHWCFYECIYECRRHRNGHCASNGRTPYRKAGSATYHGSTTNPSGPRTVTAGGGTAIGPQHSQTRPSSLSGWGQGTGAIKCPLATPRVGSGAASPQCQNSFPHKQHRNYTLSGTEVCEASGHGFSAHWRTDTFKLALMEYLGRKPIRPRTQCSESASPHLRPISVSLDPERAQAASTGCPLNTPTSTINFQEGQVHDGRALVLSTKSLRMVVRYVDLHAPGAAAPSIARVLGLFSSFYYFGESPLHCLLPPGRPFVIQQGSSSSISFSAFSPAAFTTSNICDLHLQLVHETQQVEIVLDCLHVLKSFLENDLCAVHETQGCSIISICDDLCTNLLAAAHYSIALLARALALPHYPCRRRSASVDTAMAVDGGSAPSSLRSSPFGALISAGSSVSSLIWVAYLAHGAMPPTHSYFVRRLCLPSGMSLLSHTCQELSPVRVTIMYPLASFLYGKGKG